MDFQKLDAVPQDCLRILAIEDNDFDRTLLLRELKKLDTPFETRWAEEESSFLHQLNEFKPEVILCDFSLPQFGALKALEVLKEQQSTTPLIIVTGTLTDEMAVDCLKKGAVDYIIKDKIVRLTSAIKRALEHSRSEREKQEAEKRLQQSEKQLKVITDVLPASLTYISKELKFVFCNKASEDWFGVDILEKSIAEVLGREAYAKIREGIPHLLQGGKLSFETQFVTPEAPQFVNISLVPDLDSGSIVKGFVCLITDITVSKRYENDLKTAKEEADAANNAKSQFLANMSHEMRTPLNVIQGLAELLQTDYRDIDERAIWIEKISRNCVHLKHVIDEILDLSKVESGKLQIKITRFPILETIAEVKSTLNPLAQEKNLKLVFELYGSIPKCVNSDREKLRHILLNVIGNAVKFSRTGSIVTQIRWEPAQGLTILVKDQGNGIAPEHAKDLFKPFMQADTSMTRRFGGTGLGLTIARSFARALGGDVDLVESTVGKGSTFSLNINPGDVHHEQTVRTLDSMLVHNDPEPEVLGPPSDLSNLSILLVEDSIDNQFLIRHFLESENIIVDVASNGKEGVEKVLAGSYDLIIMDVQMPVLDGYSATSRLRREGCRTPIIAFTAHAYEAEKNRCL
ncbi:MAG: response regulator, partial [Bdellovibrionales bacterium]